MNADINGFVLYSASDKKALGIVSPNHERKAACAYIPQKAKDFLVAIEDKRFYKHNGLDIKGIGRAIWTNTKNQQILQGGSTLTQQLSRNLMRTSQKSLARKIREAIKAIQLESKYSKEEILQLYFNEIYWGKNIYGLRAASLHYLGKEPGKLTTPELLSLITLLRGPNLYLKNSKALSCRFQLLTELLLNTNTINASKRKSLIKGPSAIGNFPLRVYPKASIPYISTSVDAKKKIIYSSIDKNLQSIIDSYVTSSKYPTTVIALNKGNVTAFASTYGSEHAFNFRINVGSTLKPFLHSFITDQQHLYDLSKEESLPFLDWKPREVKKENTNSLDEALFYSRNREFITASTQVGLDQTLDFLSDSLRLDRSNFHPSSLLGATDSGISLYELAQAYYRFFQQKPPDSTKKKTLKILEKIAQFKFKAAIKGVFLKTGTTNENKERLAIVMYRQNVLAILREENPIDDPSKEGNFLMNIVRRLLRPIQKAYSWM